jgi:hypothetical protein
MHTHGVAQDTHFSERTASIRHYEHTRQSLVRVAETALDLEETGVAVAVPWATFRVFVAAVGSLRKGWLGSCPV